MYFGSLTTPFCRVITSFPPPSCHHIHLLIDRIISVEITVSDEIWKLHHTCRWRKKKVGEGGGEKNEAITQRKIKE